MPIILWIIAKSSQAILESTVEKAIQRKKRHYHRNCREKTGVIRKTKVGRCCDIGKRLKRDRKIY